MTGWAAIREIAPSFRDEPIALNSANVPFLRKIVPISFNLLDNSLSKLPMIPPIRPICIYLLQIRQNSVTI